MRGLRGLLPPALGLEDLVAPVLAAATVALFVSLVHLGVLPVALLPTAHFSAAVGHFITLVLAAWLVVDIRRAAAWGRAAMEFNPGDGSWVDQAIARLTQTRRGRLHLDRLDEEFGRLCRMLRERLAVRIGVKYFPFAWLPLILGLVSSSSSLGPNEVRAASWLHLFWPFLVGAAETLLLSWGTHMLSLSWDRVVGTFLLASDQPADQAPAWENGVALGCKPEPPVEATTPAKEPATIPEEASKAPD
jgi:hypothetical protein